MGQPTTYGSRLKLQEFLLNQEIHPFQCQKHPCASARSWPPQAFISCAKHPSVLKKKSLKKSSLTRNTRQKSNSATPTKARKSLINQIYNKCETMISSKPNST